MATATKGQRTFEYAVRDRAGKLVKGRLEASDQDAVLQRLRSQGMAPISVTESKAGQGLQMEITLPGSNGVGMKDIAVMSRQFATMVSSGLTLIRALGILAEQTESKKLAKVLHEVRAEVEQGTALSTAMAKHPLVFPPLMTNMIRAGEVGGFLDGVLLRIAANYESEVKLRGKIKSAMTYPVVVLIMAVAAVFGMLMFVVPVFKEMFASLGGSLPAPTQLLVVLSEQMKWVAPSAAVLLIAFGFVWKRVKNRDGVRGVVDPLKLKVPVFGLLFQKVALSRFARNMSTMLAAGVPILQALDIVAETTGNITLTRGIRDVQESVRNGESLTGPLSKHKVFPAMMVQMMAVGEDTGAIDAMLEKISEFYDQEVEAMTESLTALLEPLMIAVLGSIIGSMVIALYMPMFSIMDQIK
ncbi:type II secretion system F family protein [Paenibacillus sp. TRM 82003]|uniref:type II secretion system F family protein n=1 Tax=Kineococcus sp. TRM81007 TaxID=2925831 RepID=UPI001F5B0022|nr:type II secretion system F family protein [Kineococcus sp. TRM81007]MCI2239005.1 type II secretion system F family protein [Kineococcus sp. TRM81007]MCI3924425.1 type II secretion system F family protein [Paenibacillus sp. TRM 82003]